MPEFLSQRPFVTGSSKQKFYENLDVSAEVKRLFVEQVRLSPGPTSYPPKPWTSSQPDGVGNRGVSVNAPSARSGRAGVIPDGQADSLSHSGSAGTAR